MKKGTSLIELIAVIVILGVIASITTVVVVNVIYRQKKNATVISLNDTYRSAQEMLILVKSSDYDPIITIVDDDFCYVTLTDMIDNGRLRGNDYYPAGDEIYFCYDMNDPFVVITSGTISKTKPEATGTTRVNGVDVTFDFDNDCFIIATS